AALQILRATGGSFAQALTIAGGDGGIDEPMDTAAGAALRVAIKADAIKPDELVALGLLTSRAAARRALEQLAAAGLIWSDPRLDMLRLNAALEDRTELEGETK